MKTAIRGIEKALKDLNNLDSPLKAEDFLIRSMKKTKGGRKMESGALYIHEEAQGESVSVGIYLGPSVAKELKGFARWEPTSLTLKQKQAFAVASEEVSHFHYLLFQLSSGRKISQLELELQGEVDTFLLSYFSKLAQTESKAAFEDTFSQAFEWFHLSEGLSATEQERYLEANRAAQKFAKKLYRVLSKKRDSESALKLIRKFYRLNLSEKLSLASSVTP